MIKKIFIMFISSISLMCLSMNNNNIGDSQKLSSSFIYNNCISEFTRIHSVEFKHFNNIILNGELQTHINDSGSIDDIIYNEVKNTDIDIDLIKAIIKVESNNNSDLICYDKYGADYGLMQIRNINHKYINEYFGYELNYLNPEDNIRAGVYILNKLYIKYNKDGLECILMAYNMGESGAKQLWNKGIYSSSYSRKVLMYYN